MPLWLQKVDEIGRSFVVNTFCHHHLPQHFIVLDSDVLDRIFLGWRAGSRQGQRPSSQKMVASQLFLCYSFGIRINVLFLEGFHWSRYWRNLEAITPSAATQAMHAIFLCNKSKSKSEIIRRCLAELIKQASPVLLHVFAPERSFSWWPFLNRWHRKRERPEESREEKRLEAPSLQPHLCVELQ